MNVLWQLKSLFLKAVILVLSNILLVGCAARIPPRQHKPFDSRSIRSLDAERMSIYFCRSQREYAATDGRTGTEKRVISLLGLLVISDGRLIVDELLGKKGRELCLQEWKLFVENREPSGCGPVSMEQACRLYIISRFLDGNSVNPRVKPLRVEVQEYLKKYDLESGSTDSLTKAIFEYSVYLLSADTPHFSSIAIDKKVDFDALQGVRHDSDPLVRALAYCIMFDSHMFGGEESGREDTMNLYLKFRAELFDSDIQNSDSVAFELFGEISSRPFR